MRSNPISAAAWAKRQKAAGHVHAPALAAPWPFDVVISAGRPAYGFWRLIRMRQGLYSVSCEAQPIVLMPPKSMRAGTLFVLGVDPHPGHQDFRVVVEHITGSSQLFLVLQEFLQGHGEWTNRGIATYDSVSGGMPNDRFYDDNGEDPLSRMPRLTAAGIADALRRALGPRVFDETVTPSRGISIAARKIEFVLRCLGMLAFADQSEIGRMADGLKGEDRNTARWNLSRAVAMIQSQISGANNQTELTQALDAFSSAVDAGSARDVKSALAAVDAALAPLIDGYRQSAMAAYRVVG